MSLLDVVYRCHNLATARRLPCPIYNRQAFAENLITSCCTDITTGYGRNMNLRQLEVFYAIMQTGSVTSAANELAVSQPAISNTLKRIEDQLGFNLFERSAGRLLPTPEALSMLPDLQEVFGRVRSLNRMAREIGDGKSGHLVVAASPALVNTVLPRAVARFRLSNPGILITIQSMPTPMAVDYIARREADIGLIYSPALDSGVVSEELSVNEVCCILRESHALASRAIIDIDDLADQVIISTNRSTRVGRAIEQECQNAGRKIPHIGIEANSSMAACLLAMEGVGIALVDGTAVRTGMFPNMVSRPLSPSTKIKTLLIYPRDRPRLRASIRFSEYLKGGLLR